MLQRRARRILIVLEAEPNAMSGQRCGAGFDGIRV
jgi:hypothetical protein